VLVLLLIAAGWFVFGRESFTQDAADLETLIEIKTRINTAHSMGVQPNEWMTLSETTEAELAPLVDRLDKQASSQDHIKQELLFAARDDVPKMFKELPNGKKTADQHMARRFLLIEDMIRNQVRQHADSAFTAMPQATSPPEPATAATPDPAQPAASENVPATADNTPVGNETPVSTPEGMTPNSQTPAPGQPPKSQPAAPAPQPAPPAGIPGRPKAAQF